VNYPFCDSSALRNSRFWAADVVQLLLIRMPVRCRNCLERSYVSIPHALQIKRESKVRRAAETLLNRSHSST
jgi:hypothetical protein